MNTDSDNDDDSFPQTWDLTDPPTREHVDMDDGRKTVFYELNMKNPREVTFHLPEGVSLTLPVYMVSFESASDKSPETSDPTGIDARSTRMSLDDTVELYRSTLHQLGMNTENATTFENEAEAAQQNKDTASPTDRVTSPDSGRMYGYLDFGVIAVYNPDVKTGLVKLIGVWGEGKPKSKR